MSWMAAIAAGLLLAIAGGWLWLRRRGGANRARSGDVQPRGEPAPARAGPDAPRAVEVAGSGHDAGDEAESEAGWMRALCARAFGGTSAAPADAATRTAQAEVETAAVAVLARIDAHPRYTPRRPQLLPQLTRAINDPAAGAQAIATILAQDPALAGNLLRIANSASYRRHAVPIENLERAVTLLGTEGLRQIVLAALLQPVITDDGSAFGRCAALLWDHTLLTAKAATQLQEGATRDEQHAAQLLALLAGLGSVAVVQVLRDAYAKHADARPDADAIAAMIATWSAPCARAISEDWGLSTRLQQALAGLGGDAATDESAERLMRALRACRASAAAALPAPVA
jgi:HD-like signal output (HDOD) protein